MQNQYRRDPKGDREGIKTNHHKPIQPHGQKQKLPPLHQIRLLAHPARALHHPHRRLQPRGPMQRHERGHAGDERGFRAAVVGTRDRGRDERQPRGQRQGVEEGCFRADGEPEVLFRERYELNHVAVSLPPQTLRSDRKMGSASSQPNPTPTQDASAAGLPDEQTRAPTRKAKKRKVAIEADAVDDDDDDDDDDAVKATRKKARKGRGRPRHPAQLVKEGATGGRVADAEADAAPVKVEESDEVAKAPRQRKKRRTQPDAHGLRQGHHVPQDGLTGRDEEIDEGLGEKRPDRPRRENESAQSAEPQVREPDHLDASGGGPVRHVTASEAQRSAADAPNVGRSEKVQLPAPLFDGPAKGMFTPAEKAALDDVFDHTVQTSSQCNTAPDLMRQIIDWKHASDFKEEAESALPNRPKPAIRKFCQRRFTLARRGPWTKEEDDILRRAYAENADKWVEIAALTDRRPADCKDRWRNILQCGEKRETGPWSAEEEAQLVEAVGACIKAMKAQSKSTEGQQLPSARAELELMVDWKTVQNKLDNKRSAKRCREKWQQLKRNGNISKPKPNLDARVSEVLREVYNPESRRQRRVERAFASFEPGDYFDVLTDIHAAIGDPTKVFQHDSTVWSIVSQKNPDSHFSGALRRRAYYAALEHYTGQSVRKATTIAGKAKAMTRLMIRWAEKQGTTVNALKRGLDAAKIQAGRWKRRKRRARVLKSMEMVVDSEDEGDAVASEDEDESQLEADADADARSDDVNDAGSEVSDEADSAMAEAASEDADADAQSTNVSDAGSEVPDEIDPNQQHPLDAHHSTEDSSAEHPDPAHPDPSPNPIRMPPHQLQSPSISQSQSSESAEQGSEEEASGSSPDPDSEASPEPQPTLSPPRIRSEQSNRMVEEVDLSSENERYRLSSDFQGLCIPPFP
ncbi:hypothetical protein EJ03DRAFT_380630 [Teratosphaeria nubilosa]|uniref:Myb-like domain-containing protein n=1 Tax=Teratosphaeria nubilosa TaxID=161662 RepID=A0A6G1LI25_9PEZI|nr:hypothetical protein EJ03DRAFT_380630 [Teratosphaeria nubilosa]